MLRSMLTAVLLILCFASDAFAQSYDFVLRSGKIVDGTGNPWFHGEVAVRGDRDRKSTRLNSSHRP